MSSDHDRPAFPTMRADGFVEDGMTIRDYFAAKAMRALLASSTRTFYEMDSIAGPIAKAAFIAADAMMKEREA